jgi:hypothetical protein
MNKHRKKVWSEKGEQNMRVLILSVQRSPWEWQTSVRFNLPPPPQCIQRCAHNLNLGIIYTAALLNWRGRREASEPMGRKQNLLMYRWTFVLSPSQDSHSLSIGWNISSPCGKTRVEVAESDTKLIRPQTTLPSQSRYLVQFSYYLFT